MPSKKALFIGDIFRVHTMLKGGKFGTSTPKLAHLLENTVACLGYDTQVIEDSTAPGVSDLYASIFGHYENVNTWAYRSQILSPRVEAFYETLLKDVSLVMGFELPESLYEYCCARQIKAFDFSFHFVRFEQDYTVMVRSNVPKAEKCLKKILHRVTSFDVFSKACPTGDDLDAPAEGGMSIFLMQTRFDKSKFDGKGGILNDMDLVQQLDQPLTHYKPHPMEHRPELELYLQSQGVKPFAAHANIYGFLAKHGHATRLFAVSSGLVAEADIIGVKEARFLAGFPWTVHGYEQYSTATAHARNVFYPVDHRVFSTEFIQAMVGDAPLCLPPASHSNFSLKDFWNVNWS